MKIDYIKLSPTGNITLLATSPVPRALHSEMAKALLARVGGEQVGYVEPATAPGALCRLQMMGGEFCGNATMSLGALVARTRGLADGAAMEMALEVSGSDAPVPCRMLRSGDGWTGTVRMPLPPRIWTFDCALSGRRLAVPLVAFPGISHLILPAALSPDEARLRRLLPEWNREIGADALGALVWDPIHTSIDPLVYVPSAGTLVREHGCGSGSAATGCWLAEAAGRSLEIALRQPGGTITVEAQMADGKVSAVAITGRVEIIEEGSVEIE